MNYDIACTNTTMLLVNFFYLVSPADVFVYI